MNAFFVLLAVASFALADAYQVFAASSELTGWVQDRYAEGLWNDPSFTHVLDDVEHWEYISGGGSSVQFRIPLNTGDSQDVELIPGQTYNVRFARGDSWNGALELWSNIYSFEVPVSVSPTAWQDSINSEGIQGVRWRRESVTHLRIQMWYDELQIICSFLSLERPNSQDLAPSTWGSIKSSF